jgi:flagellar biosynthesis protein FlhB
MAGKRKFPPSRRKLEKARSEGDVAKSKEISSSFAVLALLTEFFFLPSAVIALRQFLERCVSRAEDFHTNNMLVSLRDAWEVLWRLGLPVLILPALAVLAAEISQVGFVLSWKSLQFRWSRLNVIRGLGRIVGIQAGSESLLPVGLIVETIKSAALILLVIGADVVSIAFLLGPVYAADAESVDGLMQTVYGLGLRIAGLCVLPVIALGTADLLLSRWRRRERLKMDAEEFKKELRESEGDPEFRGMRKHLHQELLRHGVLQGVRRARMIVMGKIAPPGGC